MVPLPDLDRLSHAELKSLVVKQREETAQLRRMVAALRDEIVRLKGGPDGFLDEARDVLREGLSSAAWITVDDTGARHQAGNGFCTRMGNEHFTWFATTASKSRLNFLDLLRAGYDDYVINAAALAYMRERALAAHVVA